MLGEGQGETMGETMGETDVLLFAEAGMLRGGGSVGERGAIAIM